MDIDIDKRLVLFLEMLSYEKMVELNGYLKYRLLINLHEHVEIVESNFARVN